VSGRSHRSKGGLSAASLNAFNAQTGNKFGNVGEDIKSTLSRRSRLSKAVSVGRTSYVSKASRGPSEIYSEINEDNEWVAI